MIFDRRTYNIKPNRLAKFLETYEQRVLRDRPDSRG